MAGIAAELHLFLFTILVNDARSQGARIPMKIMSSRFLRLAAVSVFLTLPAHAQDGGGGLLDPLARLLRGSDMPAVEAAGEAQRRVPFSREEMQLSFAPLVR
jgi:hypothetical protein